MHVLRLLLGALAGRRGLAGGDAVEVEVAYAWFLDHHSEDLMRIGISVGSAFAPGDPREGARTVIAQVRAARDVGLDSLSIGDHHSTGPGVYLQNTPMLGRLLAEWDERPAGCLFLVPLWNPVLLAEHVGTLAAIASGPFIVQAGLGGGGAQFGAMGIPIERRAILLGEGIRVVRALLEGDAVSSTIFGIENAKVAPVPTQGIEWWVGGGVATAIDRAARLGDCWYGNADLTPDNAAKAIGTYREACARHDRVPIRIPIRKDVLIADSSAEAERAGDDLIAAGYRGFERAAVAYGDPDGVAEQLAVFGELGFTDVIIRTMAVATEAAVRTVELAGEVQRRLAGG